MKPFKAMKQFIEEWKKKDPKSKLWMAAGLLFLLLAAVGLAIPIVPQIPFAIISAFCFSKGSVRIHKKIRNHKRLGPPVRDWEGHRVVKPKVKAFSGVSRYPPRSTSCHGDLTCVAPDGGRCNDGPPLVNASVGQQERITK